MPSSAGNHNLLILVSLYLLPYSYYQLVQRRPLEGVITHSILFGRRYHEDQHVWYSFKSQLPTRYEQFEA